MSANVTLDDRISAAFTGNPTSEVIAALLGDVSAADTKAKEIHAAAKERALDPATPSAAVTKARREMEDCEFASQRMSAATVKLNDLLSETRKREAENVANKEMAAAIAERDALALEMAKEWPAIETKIVGLLTRLAANNRRLSQASAGRVTRTAEEIARNAPESLEVRPVQNMPALLPVVRLPSFFGDPTVNGYAWPQAGRL